MLDFILFIYLIIYLPVCLFTYLAWSVCVLLCEHSYALWN